MSHQFPIQPSEVVILQGFGGLLLWALVLAMCDMVGRKHGKLGPRLGCRSFVRSQLGQLLAQAVFILDAGGSGYWAALARLAPVLALLIHSVFFHVFLALAHPLPVDPLLYCLRSPSPALFPSSLSQCPPAMSFRDYRVVAAVASVMTVFVCIAVVRDQGWRDEWDGL